MADQQRPVDLTPIYAELAAQRAEIARLKRRRLPRRLAPLALVALLVALLPLSLLAAGPFQDLNAGSPHNINIQAIADAGITRGCDPPTYVQYCPNGLVTREEMASFLARTAGLGGNPPVANALTAVSAASAQNAAALGGQPPSAFLPAASDTTFRYPGGMALATGGATVVPSDFGGAKITVPGGTSANVVVPLPRATGEHGRFLAASALRVCYAAPAGIEIDATRLYAGEGFGDLTALVSDPTDRPATAHACYDLAVATPRAVAGMAYAYLIVANGPGGPRTLTLDSLALTATPLATGAP